MRNLLALTLTLSFSMISCTGPKSAPKPAVSYSSGTVVANQFVFSGDPSVVKAYLAENNISGEFQELSKDDSWYQVFYRGERQVGQIVADLKDKTTHVEPNFMIKPAYTMRKAEWPTAKYFFKQWALNNIGQSAPFGLPGVRGADMDVLKTWSKVTKGSEKNNRRPDRHGMRLHAPELEAQHLDERKGISAKRRDSRQGR